MRYRTWFVLFSATFSLFAHGQRRMVTPALVRRLVLDNANPAVDASQTAGTNIHVSIFLTNLGSAVQSGSARFLPGTSGYAMWNQGGGLSFTRHFYACTGTDAAGASSGTTGLPSLPRAVNWTLAANETKRLTFGMAVRQNCSQSPPLVDSEFAPIVEITVTEDKGAIYGSALPQIDGALNLVTCDGANRAVNRDLPLPNQRSGNPILINGGRAF
jgi:hypothetical protein